MPEGQTRIELCGRLRVELSGRRIERQLPGRQGRLMLAYLVLNRDRAVSRDELLDLLWPAAAPADPDAALTAVLSKLRRALGQGTLHGRRELELALPPGAWVDVEAARDSAARAERALERSDWRAAADDGRKASEIAGETLLAGHDGHWVEEARRELEELRLRALELVAAAGLELGPSGAAPAERAARAVIAAAPLRESAYGLLIDAAAARGNVPEGLGVYEELRVRLRDELGTVPGAALTERHERLLAGGEKPGASAPPPRREPDRGGEERKLVTVIAAVPSGSAEVDSADPERLHAQLGEIHKVMTAQVSEAGGRIETPLGDEVLAAFGVPLAQEDQVARALHSALAIRRRLTERADQPIPLRIGVDTGEVVVARSLQLAGVAVATARRLADAAEPGEIMVGERTFAAARNAFELGLPAPTGPGASGRPLLRARSTTSLREPRPPFVGRDRELELLQASYSRVRDGGRSGLVTVVGDPGVGKSRLVGELWDRLADATPEPLRRTGRCLPYGRGTTYRPLADVLREELTLLETDEPEAIRKRLGERQVLGLTLGLEVTPDLHPLEARERLHAAWVELLSERTAQRPALMLIEDLHWAQEPLLDLLERLLDEVQGPLLIVCTTRPELLEARPAWGRRRESATAWLEPLSAEDADRMLDELGPAGMPEELRSAVLDRAEGNPFFLEELLANMIDRGLLGPGVPGRRLAAGEVPDSVQAVLAARIDMLPPIEKAALQAASVIGRVFWRGSVLALLEGDAAELSLLESRDFVRRRPGSSLAGEREFAFKHALTREVAYASLPKARRSRLHAAFAIWLEQVAGGRDEHAAFLAHHYAESVRPEDADLAWADEQHELEGLRKRAVSWLSRAAELAVARYEIDEGLALLERALELESSDERRAELWQGIGRATALKYDGERFWIAMQEAIALSNDRTALAGLYAELAFETAMRAGMWRQRPDRDLVDGWIERALELAEPESVARAKALLAWCNWNPEGAGDAPRETAEIAERLADPELRSYALDAQGIAAFIAGDYERGRERERRRFELLDRITDHEHLADIYYAPITGYALFGEFDGARELALKHEEISLPLTAHHRIHGVAVLLEVEELVGAWERVRALQALAEERVVANADTPCVRNARSLLVCALAQAHGGDGDEARRLERGAEAMEMQGFGHVLDTPRIELALARGDLDPVERLLAEPLPDRGWHRGWLLIATHATRLDALTALGRRKELESWPVIRPETYLEPFHLRALGVVREDGDLIERALDRFERLGLAWHADQTRALV